MTSSSSLPDTPLVFALEVPRPRNASVLGRSGQPRLEETGLSLREVVAGWGSKTQAEECEGLYRNTKEGSGWVKEKPHVFRELIFSTNDHCLPSNGQALA